MFLRYKRLTGEYAKVSAEARENSALKRSDTILYDKQSQGLVRLVIVSIKCRSLNGRGDTFCPPLAFRSECEEVRKTQRYSRSESGQRQLNAADIVVTDLQLEAKTINQVLTEVAYKYNVPISLEVAAALRSRERLDQGMLDTPCTSTRIAF
jgi:hypothetical protein